MGSEGTLGIITELTVRLYGIPERILAAVCPFATLEGACNAVIQSIQLGLGVARMELLDPPQIKAVNIHAKLGLEEKPTLFLEFHGTEAGARDQVENFQADRRGRGRASASTGPRRRRTGAGCGRRATTSTGPSRPPGPVATSSPPTCACPISRLAECVVETQKDIEELGLIAPIVGHVGDGNFHTSPIFDRDDPKEMAAIETFLDRLTKRAIAMEGTCTGEHGVGQGKIKYLKAELGDGVAVMRAIKSALDPEGILNPGKIFPA